MAKKDSNYVQLARILATLESEEQKRLAELLEKNMEELKINFSQIIENALMVMVKENPTPNVKIAYDRVKSKNALIQEEKQQDKSLEKLLQECDEIVDRIENKTK